MIILFLLSICCAAIVVRAATGVPVMSEWYFGSEGLQNATIIVQSKTPCVARIGHYKFSISNSTAVKNIVSPAGEYPLSISCISTPAVEFGIRATVYVNGKISWWTDSASEWKGNVYTNFAYAADIGTSCASPWIPSENAAFTSFGGSLSAITVWPCPATTTSVSLYRVIKFENLSPTARKVTFYLGADDRISAASFGPFSFYKLSPWSQIIKHVIYVEPGVYPLTVLATDFNVYRFFAAAILIDDILVTKTGDPGWTSLLQDTVTRWPFLETAICTGNPNSGPGTINPQFVSAIGSAVQLIWTSIQLCAGSTSDIKSVKFQFVLDVKPRLFQSDYRKVDFHLGASDLFMMRFESGPPIIGSHRDAEDYFNVFTRKAPARFSLYLKPGVYNLTFSIANYALSGVPLTPAHFHGIIYMNNVLLDVTGSSGNWKIRNNGEVNLCTSQEQQSVNDLLQEVEQPFSDTGIKAIGVGPCIQPAGVYDIIYELTVPSTMQLTRTTTILATGTTAIPQNRRSNSFFQSALERRWIIYAVGAALFVIIIIASACFLRGSRKRKSIDDGTDFTKSTGTSGQVSMNTEPEISTSATQVATNMGNVFSIPAYLLSKEGMEFRADEKMKADVMMGTAFTPRLSKYGKRIVVKRITTDNSYSDPQYAIFLQEVSITAYLQTCKNIVRILGYSESPLSIILKLYSHGSLKTWIKANFKSCSKSLALNFLKDIGNALEEMHSSGFVHCDIKSDNILIDYDSRYFCVLCDFGITQVLDPKVLQVRAFVLANRQGFSIMYAAPEVLLGRRGKFIQREYFNDVFSYGVVGVELLNGGKLIFK